MFDTLRGSTLADVTTAADTVPVAVPGLAFSFMVEEPEMWIRVGLKGLGSNANIDERCVLMVKIDAASPVVVGHCYSQAAGKAAWSDGSVMVRLSQGIHKVAAYVASSAAAIATLHSTVVAPELSVLRLSNNAVLGHGVDDKRSVTE